MPKHTIMPAIHIYFPGLIFSANKLSAKSRPIKNYPLYGYICMHATTHWKLETELETGNGRQASHYGFRLDGLSGSPIYMQLSMKSCNKGGCRMLLKFVLGMGRVLI